jgi:hypothetical protein
LPVTLTEEQQKLLKRPRECMDSAKGLHLKHERKWDHFYALYRGFADWKNSQAGASPRDRDTGLKDARRRWGAELVIPYVFATVETVMPAVLSQRPRPLVVPLDDTGMRNVENMKFLVDRQQEEMDYEMRLHPTAKDGFFYGLGVQMTYWRKEVRKDAYYLAPKAIPTADETHYRKTRDELKYDDPWCTAVSPYNFFWDPYACEIADCEWIIHRTWRSGRYVKQKFESGAWGGKAMGPDGEIELPVLTGEQIQGMGGSGKYDEIWANRLKASGHEAPKASESNDLHEVWECHYGSSVVVILDRQVPVAAGPNPYWHGEFPFQVYRPTFVPHEMVGIGETEPIEDLAEEMNTLRSQRRDAATMALNAPYAYYDGLVDPADLKWGPNVAIPVPGDPRELLFQLPVKDVPASGYQEAAEIKADIEQASGLGDVARGQDDGGVQQTATGAQLVLASANKRIELKTRRLEREVIAPATRQMGLMDQQKIVSERTIVVPLSPAAGGYGAEQRWAQRRLGPDELAGQFRWEAEGGSTAPENVPQKRQDAQIKSNLLKDNPHVDQRAVLRSVLEDLGYRSPEGLMVPDETPIPPAAVQKLTDAARAGVTITDRVIQAAVATAQREADAQSMQSQGAQSAQPPQPPEVANAA